MDRTLFFLFGVALFFLSNYDIERMIAAWDCAVRCLWIYVPENNGCSAMVGILWELQRKVHVFHQSHETFWTHKKSFCR
ncbi:unnamed protein product [Sphagnum troendelagicum]|uniref:Secreted protein n=1 Tax=Sphagnum troendelagicum TaxID=128251 RepID=A0ABP0UZE1_9BRYO